jgi:hypothetical protein
MTIERFWELPQVCDECSGPVYRWQRRVRTAEGWPVHLGCWRSKAFFQDHIRRMRDEAQLQRPPLHRLPLCELRIAAARLRVAAVKLERAIDERDRQAWSYLDDTSGLLRQINVLLRFASLDAESEVVG